MNWIFIYSFLLVVCAGGLRKPLGDDKDSVIPEEERPSLKDIWEAHKRIVKKVTTGDLYKGKGVKENNVKNYGSLDLEDNSPHENDYGDYDDYRRGHRGRRGYLRQNNRRLRNYGFDDDNDSDDFGQGGIEFDSSPAGFGQDYTDENSGNSPYYERSGNSETWGSRSSSSVYSDGNGIVVRSSHRKGGGRGSGYETKGGPPEQTNSYQYNYQY